MALTKAQLIDLNGNELILDLDADTSITADTDDQIDIKIGGADDFRFTANTAEPVIPKVPALAVAACPKDNSTVPALTTKPGSASATPNCPIAPCPSNIYISLTL